MSDTNKTIFQWLHKGDDKACWHEIRTWRKGSYGGIKFYEVECSLCKNNFGREEFQVEPKSSDFNPNYESNDGFFLLLEGLRAKGIRVRCNINGAMSNIEMWVTGQHALEHPKSKKFNIDIRIALVQAVLALIEKDGE